EGARAANVPAYVTESAYTTPREVRTKVGDAQGRRKLAVLDLQAKSSVWASADVPADAGEEARDVQWSMPDLSKTRGIAIAAVRSHDNKARWLLRVDPSTGKGAVLDHVHDDAWIRDAGGRAGGARGWIDERQYWFLAERDGWTHLYV